MQMQVHVNTLPFLGSSVPYELVLWSQQGFRNAAVEIEWAAQCLDRKKLLASGILLAICAAAAYLLLDDKVNLRRIEERVAGGLGFLEEPYY